MGDTENLQQLKEKLSYLLQLTQKQAAALRDFENVANIGTWELDVTTNHIIWSLQTRRIHEVPDDFEPNLHDGLSFYKAGKDRQLMADTVAAAVQHGTCWDLELALVTAKGREIWARSVGRAEQVNGRCTRLFGVFQDVTQTKTLQLQLAKQVELMRVTMKSIGDAVITTDADGVITWMNPMAQQLTGWSIKDAEGQPLANIFTIVHEITRTPVDNPIDICLREQRVVALSEDVVLLSKKGEECAIADSAAPIFTDDSTLIGAVMVFQDVTEQRRLSHEMKYRALHDPLTGLLNRTAFDEQLRHVVLGSQTSSTEQALLLLDLDQFKIVNDTCGHIAGDVLLQQVSTLLQRRLRGSDLVARLGGDEFAVILYGCDESQAFNIAQGLCESVDAYRFIHEGKAFRIGASIGLVSIHGQWRTAKEVMQAADSACYAAKDAGRNRVHVWKETDTDILNRHSAMNWATRLENALDQDEFVLFAQKIYPTHTQDQRLHIEVLLRLPSDSQGWMSPAAFMPAAERFHLATRIDMHVVKKVLARLSGYPRLDQVAQVQVNLSGQSVGDRQFQQQLLKLLTSVDEDIRKLLCFEITETVAIRSIADAAGFVDSMNAIGIRIALDDFGAGASSFGYLKNLAVSQLKIDGQFIRDLLDDPMDEVAVNAFVAIAQIRNIVTVAEFVENEDIYARVSSMGIDYMQGYHLHMPEPLDNILQK